MIAIYSLCGNKNGIYGFKSNAKFIQCANESVMASKTIFGDVLLYADAKGMNDLKPIIHLFSDVISIPSIPNGLEYLFAYSKLYTYSLQDKPFVHIDFDFVIEHIPNIFTFTNQSLIVEFCEYYRFYKDRMFQYLSHIHNDKIQKYIIDGCPMPLAYCTGIFGGTDLVTIKKYANDAMLMAESLKGLTLAKDLHMMLTVEQGLLAVNLQYDNKTPLLFKDYGAIYKHYIGSLKMTY